MKNSTRNIIIITTCVFFILLLFHWKTVYIRKEIAKNDDRIEGIIKKIVHDNIRNDYPSLTIPHIGIDTLFVKATEGDSVINISKIYGKKLTEIEKMVSNYFCDYYKTQDSICKTESSIPFIVYPEYKDSQGNIIIQPKDLDNIKNYILFLEKEVDKAIQDTKDELSNDIERLNLWTSIWIGILGIFGAIIPLFYSYKTQTETKEKFLEIKRDITRQETELKKSHAEDKAEFKGEIDKVGDELKLATEKAIEASEKSIVATKLIESIETNIDEQVRSVDKLKESLSDFKGDLESKSQQISELAKSVDKSSKLIEQAKSDLNIAIENSTIALKSSKDLKSVVYLSNSLGNLKQLDFYKLQLFHTKMEIYLATVYEKIRNNIAAYLQEADSEIDILFNELIRDLILSTRQVRNYLNQRSQLNNLDALEISLNSLLSASKETIIDLSKEVDAKLNNLIDSLRND